MKKILFLAVICCFYSPVGKAMPPAAACDSANTYEKSNCLKIVNNNYISPNAAQACSHANPYEVDDCVGKAANKYFTAGAAQVCSGANSYEVDDCVAAGGNRQYSESEISYCLSVGSYNKDDCLKARGRRYLGPVRSMTPSEACQRLPRGSFNECLTVIGSTDGQPAHFDPMAVGLCARPFSSARVLDCLKKVKNKDYSASEISMCADRSSYPEATACVGRLGTIYRPHRRHGEHRRDGGKICRLDRDGVAHLSRKIDRIKELVRGGRSQKAIAALNRLDRFAYDCLDGLVNRSGRSRQEEQRRR